MVKMAIEMEDRGICVVCGNKTSWFCIGCKMWFCNNATSAEQGKKKGLARREIEHPTRVGTFFYYETCAIKHHTPALTRWKQNTEQKMNR